ncbi:MAG: restriction endonuclease [Cyanobacteria bacterium P01_C01_bin.118]
MSDLTPIEKIKLEKLLDMGSGYVLSFTNATFQEFILDTLQIDIYDEKYDYRSGSKANRLRGFWKKESNRTVGLLLEHLLDYWRELQKDIEPAEEALFNECKRITNRLKGNLPQDNAKKSSKNDDFLRQQSEFLGDFDSLASLRIKEEKQKRGYLLEKLLNQVFCLYDIETQGSFKRNDGGEQIDGAFKFDGWYYLVECKWTQKLTDIRQLDSLYGKISRSGKQTLGLFLSINGWSEHVRPLMKQDPNKSIILMDGFDLRCVLDDTNGVNLQDLLSKKIECLNLEGEPYYSVQRLLSS